MPLNLNAPIVTTLDKVRVEQFTVSPQLNTVMVHYSKGYEENGQYVPKEYASVNFEDVNFDPTLYNSVKDALYALLGEHLNAI
jgi:hypothetical protein